MADPVKPVGSPVAVPGQAKVDALKAATVAENSRLKSAKPVEGKPTALPGFIDFAAIQDIYGSLRDGDYWSGFTRAIRFLDSFLNPPKADGGLRSATPRFMSTSDMAELERSLVLLEKETTKLEGSEETVTPIPRVGKPNPAEGTEISITDVFTVINLILSLVEKFRKRKED